MAHPALQATTQGNSCCNISSGKPVPRSVLMTPTVSATAAITPNTNHFVADVTAYPAAMPRDSVPLAAGPPPQPLLCTFLI